MTAKLGNQSWVTIPDFRVASGCDPSLMRTATGGARDAKNAFLARSRHAAPPKTTDAIAALITLKNWCYEVSEGEREREGGNEADGMPR